MKHNLSMKSLLVFSSILTAAVIAITISYISLFNINKLATNTQSNFEKATDSGYRLEIKSQVQNVLSIMESEYNKFKAGKQTEDEAKYAAKEIVRNMRYRDDSSGYFWIDDLNYNLVMHPILPDKEGTNRKNLTDSNGIKIIQEIYKVCQNGGGFNKFNFTKADGVTVAPKLAYTGIFNPWGWMISTGNYYDDIEKAIAGQQEEMSSLYDSIFRMLIIITIIIIIGTAILFFVIVTTFAIRPLKVVDKSLNEIASGNADLTKRINIKSLKEIDSISSHFNGFTEKLQLIVHDIKNTRDKLASVGVELKSSSEETHSSVKEILSSIHEANNEIEKQSESVNESSAAMEGISTGIDTLNNMIENQVAGVTEASAAIEEMIGNINSVNQSVDKMASEFSSLQVNIKDGVKMQNNTASQLGDIVKQSEMLHEANQVISSIAQQTNLLAMNAAIEAAHAGDAGKGFSVVADEIRKLSENSSTQSKVIGQQLANIIEAINSVVKSSDLTSSSFNEVSERLVGTDQLVITIKAAMEEQAIGSDQIGQALRSINDSSIEVQQAAQKMADKSSQINKDVSRLKEATSSINNGMGKMKEDAKIINSNSEGLSNITLKIQEDIDSISSQIDQFRD